MNLQSFTASWVPAEGLGVLMTFRLVDEATPGFFAADRPIHIARAPGRLDVMGGFADYSGSLVLQLPTAEAACAAIQARTDDLIRLWSPCRDGTRTQRLSVRLGDLGLPDRPIDYREAYAFLAADPHDRWAAYLLGGLVVLARELGLAPRHGFDLLLHSDVPEGRGVASSAAIEIAALRALLACYREALGGRELSARELALLGQRVENEVVGAPCGVMDQMTAAAGEAGQLLALRCQPCEVEGQLAVPEDLEFIGLDSGVRHAIGGSDYRAVRTGAAIGGRLLAALRGVPSLAVDPQLRGYLANCPPDDFAGYRAALPETVEGAAFLREHGGTDDPQVRVAADRRYAVRAATAHPVEENARVEAFRRLLQAPAEPAGRRELGDLMFAAHAGYAACGLGEPVTDALVDLARQRREAGAAIFGAKVTGGGSGGTVVLLGPRGKVWYEALRLKKALLERTGHSGHVFRWSSPGALAFGGVDLAPRG